MTKKFATLLAPALNSLVLNRLQRPKEFAASSFENMLEFNVRRTVAAMLKVNFSDLGLAIDDLIENGDLREATEVVRAAFVLERTAAWSSQSGSIAA